MEEEKKVVENMSTCCGNKLDNNCQNCHSMHGCRAWRKCPLVKTIFWIILIAIAFYLGSQLGEHRLERFGNDRFERGGMMNWNYNNLNKKPSDDSVVGSIKVEVQKPVTTGTQ